MVLTEQIISGKHLEECFNKADKFLLFIYADWCGHCKSMKPDMKKFKLYAAEKQECNVFVGFIEAGALNKDDKINEILSKYKINPKGFPTIVFGEKGEDPEEFQGNRIFDEFKDILSKLCKKQQGGRKRRKIRRKTRKKTKKKKRKRRKKKTKKRRK